EGDVALGRAVHLDDARDAEALLEGDPDVGAQPGARRDAEAGIAVVGGGGLQQRVAAELADVHEGARLMTPHVAEERPRRELTARSEGAARPEGGREADEEALAVVEGQGGGDSLSLLDSEIG